jgi:hypothetical protein
MPPGKPSTWGARVGAPWDAGGCSALFNFVTSAARYRLARSSPSTLASPYRRAVPTTPADRVGARVDCFPTRAAFPK